MSVLNRSHLDSAEVVTGTRMVQTYKIAVLGDGGVGKSGLLNGPLIVNHSSLSLDLSSS